MADIAAIQTNADAVHGAELTLSGILHELSFVAESGQGSTTEAVDSLRSSRRHADRAVIAAGLGNVVFAAKHEAQSIAAADDADRMLGRAKSDADDLVTGLENARSTADGALGHAQSLVRVDGSSPAAEIHTRIAAQPGEIAEMAARAEEIRRRVSGSRDPDELETAAGQFHSLSDELEEASGRAQVIAFDATGYSSTI